MSKITTHTPVRPISAEQLLRDAAFVLRMTQKVKERSCKASLAGQRARRRGSVAIHLTSESERNRSTINRTRGF